MPVTTRYRTTTGAGVLAALILVLIFGSPWYVDWVQNSTDPDTAGGWFLRLLAWPAWSFDSDMSLREVFANGDGANPSSGIGSLPVPEGSETADGGGAGRLAEVTKRT